MQSLQAYSRGPEVLGASVSVESNTRACQGFIGNTMDNHYMSMCKYHPESPVEAYSDNFPDDHEHPSYADEAQFFDLDISLPTTPTSPSSSHEDHSENEFEFSFSICSANFPDPNHCISPADDLFHQGQLLPLQPIPTPLEYDVDTKDIASLQSSSDIPVVKTQFPKLLKTATKLKISLFGFRKSAKHGMGLQSPRAEYAGTGVGTDSPVPKQSRLFTVKLKVVEVPMVSLFTKGTKRDGNSGFQKKLDDPDDGEGQTCKSMDRDKKRAKQIVQKYVKKIKPLYVKFSQRSNEKIRSGDLEKPRMNGRCQGSERIEKQVSFSYFSGNLKVVYKHLGKGKQQQPSDMQQKLQNHSSESTLMEVQSAIQGAIAHCKQSNFIH